MAPAAEPRTLAGDDRAAEGAQPASSALGGYVPGLDGLRGVGMLLVLAYHARLPHTKGAILALSQFFTMSGFLITAMLLRAHDRKGIDLQGFWAARFRRLLPASLITLVGVVIFGATVATAQQLDHLPGQVASAATYTANWYFIITDQSYVDLFAAPSPVQHYWSLAIEEQLYLVLPLVLIVLLPRVRSTRGRVLAVGGAMAFAVAWTAWLSIRGASFDRLYYGTDTRAAEMLVGALLAVVLHRRTEGLLARHGRTLAWAGALAYLGFLYAVVTTSLATPWLWRGGTFLCAAASALVIVGILAGRGPLVALRAAPLRGVGKISYGIYLYHWPIFLWLDAERTGLSTWPLLALRCAVVFPLAFVSYQFVEKPIRDGRLRGVLAPRLQAGASVACVAVILGATVLVSRGDAPDPFATIRAGDDSLVPPLAPSDGTLDVLAITDDANEPVVARLADLTADDPDVELTVAEPFGCTSVVGDPGERSCASWDEEWPVLIDEHDPDVVVLLADDWAPEDLAALGGVPPAQASDLAAELLGSGMDHLSARGAPILWVSSGADLATQLARSNRPLQVAMTDLETRRDDLRHMAGNRLPDRAATDPDDYLDAAAAAVIADASLYQRADRDRLPRVLIVGDSQARSLGFGLERWAAATDRAVVWNVSTEGCGLLVEGTVDGFGVDGPIAARCKEALANLPERTEAFDPDLTIVLSSVWDLSDRTLPGWPGGASVGDPRFDEYAADAYDALVDVLTAGDGKVVWLTAPCVSFEFGASDEVPAEFTPERLGALNDELIRPLAERHPDVRIYDLAEDLCPGGRYVDEIDDVDDLRVDGIHFTVEGAEWFASTHGDDLLGTWGL